MDGKDGGRYVALRFGKVEVIGDLSKNSFTGVGGSDRNSISVHLKEIVSISVV